MLAFGIQVYSSTLFSNETQDKKNPNCVILQERLFRGLI